MEKGINKEEFLKLVDKIEMYKQEEIILQNSIINSFEEMKEYLKDGNFKTLKSRLELLYLDFDNSVSNKDKYIELFLNVVNSYERFTKKLNDSVR